MDGPLTPRHCGERGQLLDRCVSINDRYNNLQQQTKKIVANVYVLIVPRKRLEDIREDVGERRRGEVDLRRSLAELARESRQTRGHLEDQAAALQLLHAEMRQLIRRSDVEARSAVETLQRISGERHVTEYSSNHLKSMLEHRFSDIHNALLDIRNKQAMVESEKRSLIQTMEARLNELSTAQVEHDRRHAETLQALRGHIEERQQETEGQGALMQGKLSEMVDEVSGKIVSKEIKMREEALQRFLAIEKRMRALECGQMAFEKGLRQDNEKRLTALQRLHQQELTALRDLQKVESNSIMQQYRKMDEDVARLASNLDRSRHELRKVVKAEIMKRDSQVKELQKKTNELKEHLQVAITALQQAISGTQQRIGQETERLAATMTRDMHDSAGRSSRVLADVDSRLVALALRAAEHEERFEQITEERIEEVKDLRNSLVRLQGEVAAMEAKAVKPPKKGVSQPPR
ncbi:coiled-coil domain-containing protein 154 [Petromyzon marinus]|uniref:coiled-coil domain-containing protein 154 n=1 Tax=Petromyzon marinus TaxID=7757 RepID=UPI003F6E4D3D